MSQEQTFRHIIDELFQIAQPGNIKSSLWQAYQRALKENPTTLEQETEQAVSLAAEQAQRELPYTEVIEARPYHYHFHSKRWYIEVDVQHLEPEEGAATALYRVWKRQDGTMAAMKVSSSRLRIARSCRWKPFNIITVIYVCCSWRIIPL